MKLFQSPTAAGKFNLDSVLFEKANGLSAYLNEATRDVISRAVHRDLSEAAEVPGLGDAQE